MADRLVLSAGPMCDMTYFDEVPDGAAFIHHVNGQWLFDKKNYWRDKQPIANAGASETRFALYCVGGKRLRSECFMPWGFVPSADAWDLFIKNDAFFSILREQVAESNKIKLLPRICIMNECEERKADRREQSPFYHNVNGVTGLYDKRAMPYIGQLTRWICEALEGLDYSVELINEGHRRGSGSADAVNMMIPVLLEYGVEPWRISLGADVLDTSLAGFRDVSTWTTRWPNELQPPDRENYDIFIDRLHLVKYYDKLYPNATHQVFSSICHNFADKADEQFPGLFPFGRRTGYTIEAWIDRNLGSNRVCFSTDGTDHADAPSGRPSPARMKAAMLYVMRHNPKFKAQWSIDNRPKIWFDFLPNGESTANIVKIIDAMAEAHYEFFGLWPENRGKVPTYESVYPPKPEPKPDPKPDPIKPPFNWFGEWRNNWKVILAFVLLIGIGMILLKGC